MSPTQKQIDLVDAITEVLDIDFPQSSTEFTKRIYSKFISEHIGAFRQAVDDINDANDEDEMMWFQMLNGD